MIGRILMFCRGVDFFIVEIKMQNHGDLKSIIEVGRCVLADWTDVYMLYLDVPVVTVSQDTPQDPVEPVAVFKHNQNGYSLALLTASVVAEGFPVDGSEIVLPAYFHDSIKWNQNELEAEETGNTGTVSDNIEIKILDQHGRAL
jgi:hypothetical protein